MAFDFGMGAVEIGIKGQWDQLQHKWEKQSIAEKYARDIEQRDFTNWYNSPEQQMKRFTEAGLNPNLIYGQGTAGNQTSSVSVAKGNYRSTAPQIPRMDLMGMLSQYTNIEKTKQETDLVSQNVTQAKMQNAITSGTMQTTIDLQLARLRNMVARTSNEAEKQKIYLQIQRLNEQKIIIEQAKAGWAKEGFTANDPSWVRAGINQLKKFGGDFMDNVSGKSGKGSLPEKISNFKF